MAVVYISPHGKRFMSLAAVKKYIRDLPTTDKSRSFFIKDRNKYPQILIRSSNEEGIYLI